MTQVIAGLDRQQTMALAEHLEDYVDESRPVHAIDAFVDALDPAGPGFTTQPAVTGCPGSPPGGGCCGFISADIATRSSRRGGWRATAAAIWNSSG